MPDGPLIGAEEALTRLRDAGHANTPDKQFARRALAGSFCELFDPNLPVADFEGNVTQGGVVVVPAATVDADVDKGFIIMNAELRAAVLQRDERNKDVERNARAEMLEGVRGKRREGVDEKVIEEARKLTNEARYPGTGSTPVDEIQENARPPHEAAGPSSGAREVAGTDDDPREKLFEEYEKANEAALKAELEGKDNEDADEPIMTKVPLSQKEELEERQGRAEGNRNADKERTGQKPRSTVTKKD